MPGKKSSKPKGPSLKVKDIGPKREVKGGLKIKLYGFKHSINRTHKGNF